MKKIHRHLIGYFTHPCLYNNYINLADYFDLLNKLKDIDFNLKKDFKFFDFCPLCGCEIDKVKIVSRLFIDLNDYNSRRLFK